MIMFRMFKVELKKTSRMAAKAGGTIPPTEQGLV